MWYCNCTVDVINSSIFSVFFSFFIHFFKLANIVVSGLERVSNRSSAICPFYKHIHEFLNYILYFGKNKVFKNFYAWPLSISFSQKTKKIFSVNHNFSRETDFSLTIIHICTTYIVQRHHCSCDFSKLATFIIGEHRYTFQSVSVTVVYGWPLKCRIS